MKKIIKTGIVMLMCILLMTGCNYQLFDTTYSFEEAIIMLPNGEIIQGKVDSWMDYDGDQFQVVINGVTYLTHAENVVLISK